MEFAELRKDLLVCGFDASKFIEHQISDVSDIDTDVESKMLIIFDGLAKELAIHTTEIENEVSKLREVAHAANEAMLADMAGHAHRVDEVRCAVDDVKVAFERASEGAVKIGDRLSVSEAERRRVETAMNLVAFINWYDNMPSDHFQDIQHMQLDELTRHAIPEGLARMGWDHISYYLRSLRRTLLDLGADSAQRALKNILKVSEVAEEALLRAFLASLDQLMDDNDNMMHIRECQELVGWLHTFNSGQTLHKQFIYAAIEKRMPSVPSGLPGGDSAGGAGGSPFPKRGEQSPIESLSELFWMIGSVCTEHFAIIRHVFPAATVPQITRTLIQRIYNDPAFGIQGRVDNVIHPAPPAHPLPLSEYLESLLTVREKLAALYIILLELCSHPAMHGMGRENSHAGQNRTNEDAGPGAPKAAPAKLGAGDLAAAKEKSLLEVREFLDEQNAQVLTVYMGDYFLKEQAHIRNQYAETLRRIFSSSASTANNPVVCNPGQTPRLRADRVGTVHDFVNSVCNSQFLRSSLRLTRDCVLRIQSIARDEHKLSSWIKDMFVSQVEFLLDGVIVPSLKECAAVMLKKAGKGAVNTTLPPMEFLRIVTFACSCTATLRANMEEVFIAPLRDMSAVTGSNGNMLVVCREYLRNSMKPVDSLCREGLRAWSNCITFHTERLLVSMQSKGDYANTFLHAHAHTSTSAACEAVCKTLKTVAKAVHELKTEFVGLDLEESFWRPFGRQFMGSLISHLRRQKISEDGAITLLLDLEQYLVALRLCECKENIDMMLCLQEIAQVYTVSADKVKKVVIESLRHLDTDLVLALTKARADYGVLQIANDHWTRTIATTYSFSKWDHELPWEKGQASSRNSRIVSSFGLVSSAADSNKGAAPTTLRKTAAKVSSLYMEIAQAKSSVAGASDRASDVRASESGAEAEDSLMHITGPSSFAAAMTARFAAVMPSRPADDTPSSGVDSAHAGETEKSAGFRPLTFLSNVMHGATVARPDLVGRDSNAGGRESVFLINTAKSNLTSAEAKQSAPAPSATPMRDSMRSLFSSMTGSGSTSTSTSTSKNSQAPGTPALPPKKAEPAQERPKSLFSGFGFGRS